MSLRLRVNLVLTLVIVAFTTAITVVIVLDTRSSVREEIESATRVAVQLVETLVRGVYAEPGPAERNDALLAFLRRVGRVRANEIRFYDHNGRLLYESPPSTYRAGRVAPEWFTRLVAPKVDSSRLALPGGEIVVTPDPSRSIVEAWDDLAGFAGLALAFLVVINLVVLGIVDRSLKPLPRILEGLAAMAHGQLQTRLPAFRPAEFASLSDGFNRMAQALEESLAQNRQLALVAQQSSDAILIRDLEGQISFCNAAAERLLGFRRDELMGGPAQRLVPAGRHGELAAMLESIMRREHVELLETQRLTKSGQLVEVALSAAPLVDPTSDRVIGEICSMRDITERKHAEETERELEQNRRLTQLMQTRLEEERRSIARELHDELGQCVTAIKTIGAAIANRTAQAAPEIHRSAQTIVQVASHIYDVVHGIIRQLRPSALDHLGLQEAIEDVVKSWGSRHPEISYELKLTRDLGNLGEAVNITVYRLIQECLTNVIRHAEATHANIEVSRDAGGVRVSVSDNGKGLGERGEGESARFGLMGMRERVQALNGEFHLESKPGAGLQVTALIPVPAQIPDGLETERKGADMKAIAR